MLRNQIKTAYRNFLRHKLYSAINLSGFVICMVSLSLIVLHIQEETGYDSFHSNADNIYRLTIDASTPTYAEREITAGFMVAEAIKEYPEVEYCTRVWNDYSRPISVVQGDQKFIEDHVYFTDASFFDVFDVEMVVGDAKKALAPKDGLIITQETAAKYFGDQDPIGEVFTIVTNESSGDYIVTGVAKRFPKKSHFNFDFLASTQSVDMWWKDSYSVAVVITYIKLLEGADVRELKDKIQSIVAQDISPTFERWFKLSYEEFIDEGYWFRLGLQPLSDIYLYSDFRFEMEPLGSITELRIIGLIGVFILILAIINYVNLSTASASLRMKEIGIRTVMGSRRNQLVTGFLIESLLVSSLGVFISIVIVVTVLPWFNDYANHTLTYAELFDLTNLAVFFGLSITLGLLAGAYPSLVMSRVYPTAALKGTVHSAEKGTLRNVLVVIQFSVSVFLIIATLVVSHQLEFVQNQKLGFDKSNVIAVERSMADLDKVDRFTQLLTSLPSIQSSSVTSSIGEHVQISTPFTMVKGDPASLKNLSIMKADEGYLETLKINLVEGRWFSHDFKGDSMAIVLNKAALQEFGIEDPIGKEIHGWLKTPHTIIGVVDDFHTESLHTEIRPLGILSIDLPYDVPFISHVLTRTTPGVPYQSVLEELETAWDQSINDRPFQFKFLDDHLNSLYEKEQQTANIFQLFSLIAIAIASLGLFGLVTFIVNRKLKEIGIRKVLGAGILNLYRLFSTTLSKPIIVSLTISIPLSLYVMQGWLEEFAYRISVGVTIPMMALCTVIGLVIVTISYTIIHAANQNPAEILKDE